MVSQDDFLDLLRVVRSKDEETSYVFPGWIPMFGMEKAIKWKRQASRTLPFPLVRNILTPSETKKRDGIVVFPKKNGEKPPTNLLILILILQGLIGFVWNTPGCACFRGASIVLRHQRLKVGFNRRNGKCSWAHTRWCPSSLAKLVYKFNNYCL